MFVERKVSQTIRIKRENNLIGFLCFFFSLLLCKAVSSLTPLYSIINSPYICCSYKLDRFDRQRSPIVSQAFSKCRRMIWAPGEAVLTMAAFLIL